MSISKYHNTDIGAREDSRNAPLKPLHVTEGQIDDDSNNFEDIKQLKKQCELLEHEMKEIREAYMANIKTISSLDEESYSPEERKEVRS